MLTWVELATWGDGGTDVGRDGAGNVPVRAEVVLSVLAVAGLVATALVRGGRRAGSRCRRFCTACIPVPACSVWAAGVSAPERAMPTTTTAQPATVTDATAAPTIRPGLMSTSVPCGAAGVSEVSGVSEPNGTDAS